MIWTLIRKEMLDQMLSIRFSVSLVLAIFFLIPATYMLAMDYEPSPEREPDVGGYSGPWYGVDIIPSPLSVLVTGLGESSGEGTLYVGPQFSGSHSFVHSPNGYLFSRLDFMFFFNIIGSLMAFTFAYDAISGERRRGTLRLMMTCPISRPLLLLSKFAGIFLSFIIAVLPGLVGVALVIHLHPNMDFNASDWGAAGFLFLLAVLYLAAISMLGLFVSCVTKIPKTTLAALMTIWVLLVLVIPNFSPILASRLHPVRSVHEVEAQIAALRQDRGVTYTQIQTEVDAFIQQHGENWDALSESEKEAVDRIWGERIRTLMNLNSGEFAEIRLAFINEVEQQAGVSQYLSLVSPSSALVFLATGIAHTGANSEWDFRRAFIRWRRRYSEDVDRYIERTGEYDRLWSIDEDGLPPFEYRGLGRSQVIAAYLPHLVVLLLYSVLFFLGAQIAFIRAQL